VTDWQGHARREAAAILTEADFGPGSGASTYPTILALCAIAWLQGVNYGSHETLRQAEDAFDALKASL
jgi:hypothetical protein